MWILIHIEKTRRFCKLNKAGKSHKVFTVEMSTVRDRTSRSIFISDILAENEKV